MRGIPSPSSSLRLWRNVNVNNNPLTRTFASQKKQQQKSQSPSSSSGGGGGGGVEVKNADPPSNVFKKTSGDLGPGASKDGQYKNPEYYQYHQFSYAEMEIVMAKLRNPQPSSKNNQQ